MVRVLGVLLLAVAVGCGDQGPAVSLDLAPADLVVLGDRRDDRADAAGSPDAKVDSPDARLEDNPCALPGTPPAMPAPGTARFDPQQAIEHVVGDLPIVISSAHGGDRDNSLPPRDATKAAACAAGSFVTKNDSHSQELARALAAAILALTGYHPHLVINRLRRDRLDANRDICVAATGNAATEAAWQAFHGFIGDAKAFIAARCGRGLLLDIHTHGHKEPWVELGYLLSATSLEQSDAMLDGKTKYASSSSLYGLTLNSTLSFSALLRGDTSFGAALASGGYNVVPSPATADPAGKSYFSGGYNTRRHGSRKSNLEHHVDAVQIETRFSLIDTAAERDSYARALAEAVVRFLETHYGYSLRR